MTSGYTVAIVDGVITMTVSGRALLPFQSFCCRWLRPGVPGGHRQMRIAGKFCLAVLTYAFLASGCSSHGTQPPGEDTGRSCHIIYDAGSKGTRLYIYEQSSPGWIRHIGPKTGAMADPVREMRGKTMADAETVVNDIVNMLEQIRTAGPTTEKGKPQWPAFDWRKNCSVRSASVYATAGMRLAEQKSPASSESLWGMLNQRLSKAVGIEVTTRTLSGYEEGMFAWLAIAMQQPDLDFGMAEMGGGSMQITFPCSVCAQSRQVRFKGKPVALYSHSFLGWGQDEAWQKFGNSMACRLGAAKQSPSWEVDDCTAGMAEFEKSAVETLTNIELANPGRWLLSDAFGYMRDDDIERYCLQGDDTAYEPESACFRAVFLQKILETLGLPVDSKRSDSDWTLGAVICTATRCLESG